MKLNLSFYINNESGKNLINKIQGMISTETMPMALNEKEDYLLDVWGGVELPPIHEEKTLAFNIDSYYGEIEGFTSVTCYGNKIALAITTEDDGEDYVVVLQYDGTRGRFIEEVAKYFGREELAEILRQNDCLPILTDDALISRHESIISYVSKGPWDMLPWEGKADYLIRKGGRDLANEVKEILKELSGIDTSNVFHFGVKDGETKYTPYYTYNSNLTYTSNAILEHWFDDAATRDDRVNTAKAYFAAVTAANSILSLI